MPLSEKQRQKARAASRANYQKRVASGLCIYCPNPAKKPHVRCEIHIEIVADYRAGQRDIRKVQGVCTECGKNKPREGLFSCQACADRMKKNSAKKYQKRKQENL